MSRIKELIQVSEDERIKAREHYGKTESDVREDLNILKEWLTKQPHLPQNIHENHLENILIRNKFRIEIAKIKLDKYYRLRGIYPEFFQTYNINSEYMKKFRKGQIIVPMPLLTDKQERIMVYKMINPDPDLFNCKDLVSYILLMVELIITYDYAVGDIVIKDWSQFSFAHFTKMEPMTLTKFMSLYQEAYSSRLIGFEYINCPPFMDKLLGFFKPIFKAKIFNRITLHKDLESLHRNVDKKYLPRDFGGEQKSLAELHEEWGVEMTYQENVLLENAKLVSDETKRIEKLCDSDLFGTEGTFKKLNLD